MDPSICKSCGYEGITGFLSLGNIPPVNAFISESEIHTEEAYPLNLAYCPLCYVVQLGEIVSPDKLFRNYLHLSAGSPSNIKHLSAVADYLGNKLNITPEKKVLEIGSNDGTLLSFFKKYTPHVLGVDPAKNLVELNKEKGVDYIAEFFDTSIASKILKQRGKFDAIIGLNVIPHTPNNIALLKGARIILEDKGTLVMEGVYALETILRGEFDTIYHEHVYTFSLHALINVFRFAGLTIYDVERIPTQGGSLRVYAMKSEYAPSPSLSVQTLLQEEKKMGFADPQTYASVEENARKYKHEMQSLINEKVKKGKLIGLGAPARGVVIMNYCAIGPEHLDYIIDDTPLKQGKLSPGTHVPVKSWDSLERGSTHTFLLLSWNYKEHLLNQLKNRECKGEVIIPFPKLEVINLD
jgi:SAM-dependent methyltransferase